MATILDSEATLKALTKTIQSLSIEEKYKLLEIIEQQIFAAEEENYKDDRETLDEVEAIQNYEEKNRALIAKIRTREPKPGTEAIREKLKQMREKRKSNI